LKINVIQDQWVVQISPRTGKPWNKRYLSAKAMHHVWKSRNM